MENRALVSDGVRAFFLDDSAPWSGDWVRYLLDDFSLCHRGYRLDGANLANVHCATSRALDVAALLFSEHF